MTSNQLPPGQQLAAPGKWPIVGEREPAPFGPDWTLQITGCVANPKRWSLAELRALPQEIQTVDIHCVTRWSVLGAKFTGIPLARLLALAKPTDEAKFISFVAHSPRSHSTSLPLSDALALQVFIALEADGVPISIEHGGPLRSITPGRYFYKSLKWLTSIELLHEDRLGYWEGTAGYHNRADPWNEERFVASGISKQEAARILVERDISGRDLLGLDGSDRDLSGLVARGALLRNANFRRANLSRACFDGTNLTNAQFTDANLTGASMRNADVEGATFIGCDLRGTDLRGASIFGALFIDPAAPGGPPAKIDSSTQIDSAALEPLTPMQAEFLARQLGIKGR